MRKRTQAREDALKILYQIDITRMDSDVIWRKYWEASGDGDDPGPEIKDFAHRLVYGTVKNLSEIDGKVSQYATNWQLKRMAIIDRNILRLGVFELLHAPDIPPKVTINEAVELAKKYGDMESSKFVNGILDKIHKTEAASLKSSS